MFFPSLPWWQMVVGGALWPWRLRSNLAPPPSWSNIQTCKELALKLRVYFTGCFVTWIWLLFLLKIILTITASLIYLYCIVSTICDQQRLSMQECCCGDGCAVNMSLLSDELPALQIPECNVALRAAWCQDRRTVYQRERERETQAETTRKENEWDRVLRVWDHNLYLFWKQASWLVPSLVWSSSESHPIGCCE